MAGSKRVHAKLCPVAVPKRLPSRLVGVEIITDIGRTPENFEGESVAIQGTIGGEGPAAVVIVHLTDGAAVGVPTERARVVAVVVVGVHDISKADLA